MKFAAEARKLSAPDFIRATREFDAVRDRFTAEDWKFICSHLGRRAERLLRNVVKNFSFDD